MATERERLEAEAQTLRVRPRRTWGHQYWINRKTYEDI